jgi:hypothetical protein
MAPVLYALVPTALVIGVIVWFLLRLKKTIAARRVELDEILAGRPTVMRDDGANCFGLESLGATQLRGNGLLALADDELVFLQFMPKRVVRVPLEEIIVVDECDWWLGKSVFQPLLRVAWREGAGQERAAWWVRDAAGWRTALERARKDSPGVSQT